MRAVRGGPVVRQAIVTVAVLVLGGSATLGACPVCFGAAESPLVDGTRLGVFAMLAVTLVIQGSFAGFFFYLRKRAKDAADVEIDSEWSRLQK